MLYQFFIMALLLLGLLLFGCAKPTMGDQPPAFPQEKVSDTKKTDKEAKDQVQEKKREKPSEAKKVMALKDSLERYRFKWSDEKESDFSLIIELESLPVPEEIKGPFPENADWRGKEKKL
jgi:hypothetical protein